MALTDADKDSFILAQTTNDPAVAELQKRLEQVIPKNNVLVDHSPQPPGRETAQDVMRSLVGEDGGFDKEKLERTVERREELEKHLMNKVVNGTDNPELATQMAALKEITAKELAASGITDLNNPENQAKFNQKLEEHVLSALNTDKYGPGSVPPTTADLIAGEVTQSPAYVPPQPVVPDKSQEIRNLSDLGDWMNKAELNADGTQNLETFGKRDATIEAMRPALQELFDKGGYLASDKDGKLTPMDKNNQPATDFTTQNANQLAALNNGTDLPPATRGAEREVAATKITTIKNDADMQAWIAEASVNANGTPDPEKLANRHETVKQMQPALTEVFGQNQVIRVKEDGSLEVADKNGKPLLSTLDVGNQLDALRDGTRLPPAARGAEREVAAGATTTEQTTIPGATNPEVTNISLNLKTNKLTKEVAPANTPGKDSKPPVVAPAGPQNITEENVKEWAHNASVKDGKTDTRLEKNRLDVGKRILAAVKAFATGEHKDDHIVAKDGKLAVVDAAGKETAFNAAHAVAMDGLAKGKSAPEILAENTRIAHEKELQLEQQERTASQRSYTSKYGTASVNFSSHHGSEDRSPTNTIAAGGESQIARLQKELVATGFLPKVPSTEKGGGGPETNRALGDFQAAAGLHRTGNPNDPATLAALHAFNAVGGNKGDAPDGASFGMAKDAHKTEMLAMMGGKSLHDAHGGGFQVAGADTQLKSPGAARGDQPAVTGGIRHG